jgi:undecaprenyl-diphosphatase
MGVMMSAREDAAGRVPWIAEARAEVHAVDQAMFDAATGTSTPVLDRVLVRVSGAANYSRVWLLTAGAVAVAGGRRGRRAACQGVLAIALASAVTNVGLKPLARRRRPVRSDENQVPDSRRVRRPVSTSFPSGHAASAFAFASAAGEAVPVLWLPLHLAAALVAYSRVHTGVHYPSDVIAGALTGAACGWTAQGLAVRLPAGWRWWVA